MSKKNTLEQAYFHIFNGGMTLSFVQRIDQRKEKVFAPYPHHLKGGESDKDQKKRLSTPLGEVVKTNRKYSMEIRFTSLGTGPTIRCPISPLIVDWLIEVLPRVSGEMKMPRDEKSDGIEYGFREGSKTARVQAQDSRKVDYHWPMHLADYKQGGSKEEEQSAP